MKNFEFENAELKSLSNDEMRQIDGGDVIDWLDSHWTELKNAVKDSYNRAMNNCHC